MICNLFKTIVNWVRFAKQVYTVGHGPALRVETLFGGLVVDVQMGRCQPRAAL